LEVGKLRQVDGKANRLPGDERRVLHVELRLLRPTGYINRVFLWTGTLSRACASAAARHRQQD
jgi:hypothetical protein